MHKQNGIPKNHTFVIYNTNTQLSKFRAKYLVEINDNICGSYKRNSQNTMVHTGAGADAAARQADGKNKQVMFESYAPFADCLNEKNKTIVDHGRNLDVAMPMYNRTQRQLFKKVTKFKETF